MCAFRIGMGNFREVDGRAAEDGDEDGQGPYRQRAVAPGPRPRYVGTRRTIVDVPIHLSVKWFRMERTSLELLRNKLLVHLLPRGPGRFEPVPIDTIILASLRGLASGAAQNDLALSMGISQTSVSKHLDRFVDAVIEEMHEWVGWYETDEEAQEAKEEFFSKSRIPGITGIIDGTHIAIKSPSPKTSEPNYVNRKGYHSLNVQIVVGANERIRNIWPNFPGSTHDGYVWSKCLLREHLLNNRDKGVLIGK